MKQFNIIMDVLGGYSKELESTMRTLAGSRSKEVVFTKDAEGRPLK